MKPIITTKYNGVDLTISNFIERKFCQQEIGRCDIKGRPIKEGDIIVDAGRIDQPEVVVYNKRACAFCFDTGYNDTEAYSFAHGWGESQLNEPEEAFEIVGTIYGTVTTVVC